MKAGYRGSLANATFGSKGPRFSEKDWWYLQALGLNRTGHLSFLTGQDRTPKFAGQVLSDQTESRLIFLTFYLKSIIYQFSYDKVHGHKYGVKKSKVGYVFSIFLFFFYF